MIYSYPLLSATASLPLHGASNLHPSWIHFSSVMHDVHVKQRPRLDRFCSPVQYLVRPLSLPRSRAGKVGGGLHLVDPTPSSRGDSSDECHIRFITVLLARRGQRSAFARMIQRKVAVETAVVAISGGGAA